jgi:hypothetical protein
LAIEKREFSSEREKIGSEIGYVGDSGDGEEAWTIGSECFHYGIFSG